MLIPEGGHFVSLGGDEMSLSEIINAILKAAGVLLAYMTYRANKK